MSDPYLLLTPILMLGVLALVRFVGCNQIFGLDPTLLRLDPPEDVTAVPGDQRVDLTWFYSPTAATSFTIVYGTAAGGPYPNSLSVTPASGSRHSASVAPLTNGTTYFFKVKGDAAQPDAVVEDSLEVSATPGVTAFVQSASLGPERNNFQGWVGMTIEIGPAPVLVTQLGRIVGPANVGTHVVKLVEAGPAGADLGSVTLNMPGAPVGQFAFASLAAPVPLLAFRQYYVVSHEEAGGDRWFDLPTTVTTTPVAAVLSGVFSDDAAPGFTTQGGAGQTYGPVNFRY